MKRITSNQFKQLTDSCPSWALHLNEPIQVSGYCRLFESPITHLSPLLHFTGRNESGKCAEFMMCENLSVAEGNFAGEVDFSYSGIFSIGQLTIKKAGKSGNAADFTSCNNLRIATGIYPGAVIFKGSGLQRIENLIINKPNADGLAVDFYFCKQLRHAEGCFPGHVDFTESGIQRIGDLRMTSADFSHCEELTDASSPSRWLDDIRVTLDHETRIRLEAIRRL